MPNVKTAISIEKPIFDQIDAIARRRKLSRSRVFALAAEEFIQRHRNQELLEAINAAHSEDPDEDEKLLAEGMRKKHAQIVQDRW
jgi:metal-responsive CopG/Arc/MetJ family transcriptional regulator